MGLCDIWEDYDYTRLVLAADLELHGHSDSNLRSRTCRQARKTGRRKALSHLCELGESKYNIRATVRISGLNRLSITNKTGRYWDALYSIRVFGIWKCYYQKIHLSRISLWINPENRAKFDRTWHKVKKSRNTKTDCSKPVRNWPGFEFLAVILTGPHVGGLRVIFRSTVNSSIRQIIFDLFVTLIFQRFVRKKDWNFFFPPLSLSVTSSWVAPTCASWNLVRRTTGSGEERVFISPSLAGRVGVGRSYCWTPRIVAVVRSSSSSGYWGRWWLAWAPRP